MVYNPKNSNGNSVDVPLNNKMNDSPFVNIEDFILTKELTTLPVLNQIEHRDDIMCCYENIYEHVNDFIHEVEIEDSNLDTFYENGIPLSTECVEKYVNVDTSDHKDENKTNQSPIGRHIAMKKAGQHPRKLSQIAGERKLKHTDVDSNTSNIDDEHSSDDTDMKMVAGMETVRKRKSRRIIRNKNFKDYITLQNITKYKGRRRPIKKIDENVLGLRSQYSLNGNKYTCNVCKKTFTFRSHLIRHLNMHTGIKQFKCQYCNKLFINKYNLSVHLKRHNDNFTLKCSVCLKGFSSPSILKRHMLSHTGELSFQCKYCDKQFTQSGSLKLHGYMHLHSPSYSCHICYKTFSYTNSLAAHMKTHTGIKPHKCTVCSRCFTRNTSLQRHIVACHKYICKICSIQFTSHSTYSTHVKSHKHICGDCNVQFENNKLLLIHVNKKHNNASLMCEQCGKTCVSKIMLIKHLQRHLSNEI